LIQLEYQIVTLDEGVKEEVERVFVLFGLLELDWEAG
jgi:hypothetical protein